MNLTPAEIENLKKQISDLQETIQEDSVARDGIGDSESEALKNEALMKKQFNYNHGIIINYEKEIEALNGEYIAAPFGEQDVDDHANEKGRLYQGLTSTDPKVIPEMIGQGLAPSPLLPNETNNFDDLEHLLNTITNGEDPFAFTPTTLQDDYSAGDDTFKSNGAITPNHWYLLGKDCLIKVGAVDYTPADPDAGTCSLPAYTNETDCTDNGGVWTSEPVDEAWTATISERYFLEGLDQSISSGGSIESWSGYSNSERTSKTASSTTQRFMDELIGHIEERINRWISLLGKEISSMDKNKDPDLVVADKQIHQDYLNFANTYISSLPLNDGTPGIDELTLYVGNRKTFIPTRVSTAKQAKEKYYAQRVNFTKTRCNIQSGTLTRLKFLDILKGEFPVGGNPNQKKTLSSMKKLLSENS